MVEAAIVIPVVMVLMAGGFEFGRGWAAYQAVDKSMRGAVRYLARVPADGVEGWGLTNAKNLALTGTLDGSGTYVVASWTDPESIDLTEYDSSDDAPKVRLTAAVPLEFPMLPFVGLGDTLTFTVSHEERVIGE